jgi:hypothetical protein
MIAASEPVFIQETPKPLLFQLIPQRADVMEGIADSVGNEDVGPNPAHDHGVHEPLESAPESGSW